MNTITRRDAITRGGRAVLAAGTVTAALVVPMVASATATEDETLLTDCDRWHVLRQDINTLLAEPSQRETRLPARFQRSIGIDPRGAAEMGVEEFDGRRGRWAVSSFTSSAADLSRFWVVRPARAGD